MGIMRKAGGRKPGDIFMWPADSTPAGALDCPIAPTNVSRAAYPKIFKELGTTWGAGDGVTTFGLPYFPAGYAPVQANGNVATKKVGQVIAHIHGISAPAGQGSGGYIGWFQGNNSVLQNRSSASVGGSENLAAGMALKMCIQYA